MKKFITVYGMTCEYSKRAIMDRLENTQGIQNVVVKLPTQLLEIDFDSKAISLISIKKIIQELGFDPM
jgi:copper chaperone CopZ